jgi:acetyl-CoA acyltransferase
MKEAVIVSAVRTAVGKAPRGILRYTRPDEVGATVLKEVVKRTPGLDPIEIDDVIIGCAFPEVEQGMNLGRILTQRAGFPESVPGQTVNRFCASGLQSIAIAAEKIMCGFAEVVVAGGVEFMSFIPIGGLRPAPNPELMESYPQAYISMGLTAENVADRYGITREDQDAFGYQSQMRAVRAVTSGRFRDEIVPIKARVPKVGDHGITFYEEKIFDTDEGIRPDTTLERLARLRPVFKNGGSVTAGNSSQTSDGAAAVIIMSKERAKAMGLEPLLTFRAFAAAGVPPDVMGIGPTAAVPKVLKLTGLSVGDLDLIELNEAFASQSLYCIRTLGLDPEKVNVNGGAIALGHPLGCTGTKLTVTLLHEIRKRKGRWGLVTMCIGGGMGAAAIFENEAA